MKKTFVLQYALVFVFVCVIITWFGIQRYQDYSDYHKSIAATSTQSVSVEVTRFIHEKKRLITLFVEENIDLVEKVMMVPDDDQVHETINARLKAYFPQFFAFTISDNHGHPMFEDFDGLMGDACILDLQLFARTRQQRPDLYHEYLENRK